MVKVFLGLNLNKLYYYDGERLKQKNEIVKFGFTGIIVIAIDIGVYYLLINFLSYFVAKSISFVCGGVVAYLLNKYWTFKQVKKSSSEIQRFIVANLSALGINVATNKIVLSLNEQDVFLALAVATATTAIFTFVVFKFWVFQRKV